MTDAGWPGRRGEVDDAPLGDDVQAPPADARTRRRAAAPRAARRRRARAGRASEISTSKWPALASTAPSRIRSKCSRRSTSGAPVTVMKISPSGAAASALITVEALHPRLERAHRVDLADDHRGARALRAAAATPRPAEP